MSRSDERKRRKAEKLARFEASKAGFVEKVTAEREPRLAALPESRGMPRIDQATQAAVDARDTFRPISGQAGSRLHLKMTWCVSKSDQEGEWSWKEPRAWAQAEWERIIFPAMTNLSQLTWREIDSAGSGKGHKMHHSHEISDLCSEAQQRWLDLGFEQFDTVFRFRIGGQKKRAWGFEVQGHFYFVWWERNHNIYPIA